MNLSKQTLTTVETNLLDLGLTFVPTINKVNYSCIEKSLHKLIRTIKLKDHFDDEDQAPRTYDHTIKTFTHPSDWEPSYKDLGTDTKQLISKLQQTTETILRKYPIKDNNYLIKNTNHNITLEQRQAINKLRDNDKIIIKPADKGGMVCVLDKTSYLTEAYRQLDNTKYYKHIDEPMQKHNIPIINNILEDLLQQGYISKKQFEYLNANETDKLRHFYLLPKIHKPVSKWTLPDMPEGRPIVGDCGTESRRVSEYIDSFLKPLANQHSSYIKDTYDFVNKIKNLKIDNKYLLVTGDLTALYTNMNIDRTITVIKDIFLQHPDPLRPDKELLELLEIALKNNDFSFCNKFFLQVFGTAMGKTFAPNCANIYLIEFDNKACNDYHITPEQFFRFLDDVFFLWPGTVDELKQYEQFLNSLIPDITITLNYSDTQVNFLDTTVFKHTVNDITTLQTKVYFKDTDTHQLLHHSSYHPKHTFMGILKSQVLRFKRLSSFKSDYDNACYILFSSLQQRGYVKSKLRKTKRDIWLNYRPRSNSTTNNTKILPIVIPFSPLATELVYAWKQLLTASPFFQDYRIISAFSRNKNLGELLKPLNPFKPKQHIPGTEGSFKCEGIRCKTCIHVNITKTFVSTYTRRQYNIIHRLTCKSSNVIYLITCNHCNKQYVGETQRQLCERVTDHRSNILTKKNTPIANHFNLPEHSILNLTITPIDTISAAEFSIFKGDTKKLLTHLLKKESYFQQQLSTLEPHGINLNNRK